MTNQKLADDEFRALLDLFMVSDPWPLRSSTHETTVEMLLTTESESRGFGSWIEAYHGFKP